MLKVKEIQSLPHEMEVEEQKKPLQVSSTAFVKAPP